MSHRPEKLCNSTKINVTHVNKTLIKAPYPFVSNSTQGPLYKTLKVIQNLGLQPFYKDLIGLASWLRRILVHISNDTVGTMNIKHSNLKCKIWNFWAVEIVTGVLVFYEESNYFIITYELILSSFFSSYRTKYIVNERKMHRF